MYKEVFIKDFSALGEYIKRYLPDISANELLNNSFNDSYQANPLFTFYMQIEALGAICNRFLNYTCLTDWLIPYANKISKREKTVGIVMAGNLPLVGFHDLLTVLASGCKANIKLSAKDRFLLPALLEILYDINPFWKQRISISETLPEGVDLIISTGGEQASLIMDSFYIGIPKITRTSRSGIAILNGEETREELLLLAGDIFLYYGLGCRNVSTILVPEGYTFDSLKEAFDTKNSLVTGEDYRSAYRYQRALCLMQNIWFIDGGFYIIKTDSDFPPPMGVVNTLFYKSVDQIYTFVNSNAHKLQCVVNKKFGESNIAFGETQYPHIDDYADGINSLEFILNNI